MRRCSVPARASSGAGRSILVVGVLVFLVAACSPDASDVSGTAVRPIDEVLDSSIVVATDPSGTAATLTVTTTIPLACAVIYGVDDDFGSLATDDDMDGGAHTDHTPIMLGLEPQTEYRYVLQGSDAAGNLYRSDVLSFSTPAASPDERPGENVAPTGTVVDVSSEYSDGFAAPNAIDGDPATEWSTDGDGDDAFIIMEVGEPTDVSGFGIRSRSMGDGSSIIRRYEVTVDDGEVLGPFDASADGLAIQEVQTSGTRFRFDAVSTTGGNTGAVEIEIYATSR